MSSSMTKSPIWATAVIVGLVAATALVAGLVDRPGANAQATSVQSKCDGCPLEGTPQCCKAGEEPGCSVLACTAEEDAEQMDGSGCYGKESASCASEVKLGCKGGRCGGGTGCAGSM